MSRKQTQKNFCSNRNKAKQDLFLLCFGLFRVTKYKKFRFVPACFGVSNLYRNNQNKQNCFETNQNNPKFSEKYQNMLSIKTLCFGIEAKQTVLKQTKINQNNPKFSDKKYQNMLSIKLFWLLFCLFRFIRNTETLFR